MQRLVAAGAVLVAAGLMAACSGSGDSGGSAAKAPDEERQAAGLAPAQASKAPLIDRSASSSSSDSAPTLPTSVIRTADLSVDITGARNVSTKADAAGDLAVRSGGEIDSDERTSGKSATATLKLRVPPAELQPTLRDLARLGKAKSRHLSSRDVTKEVADVRSRVASAERTIARLRDLYDRADKVSDVLAIESDLDQREADLESLQAQQRALAAQTSLATITLYLRTAPVAPKGTAHQDDHSGFLGGLGRGWDAFTGALGAVAVAAGAMLPFLGLLLLVAALVRLVRPRLRRRVPEPTP